MFRLGESYDDPHREREPDPRSSLRDLGGGGSARGACCGPLACRRGNVPAACSVQSTREQGASDITEQSRRRSRETLGSLNRAQDEYSRCRRRQPVKACPPPFGRPRRGSISGRIKECAPTGGKASSGISEDPRAHLAPQLDPGPHQEEGQFGTLAELADAERISRSYVCRVLRLTLLAPVVERILDGRPTAGAAHFLKPFPIGWEKQRNQLL